MPPQDQSREILLQPGSYVFLQKEGSGVMTVHVGPCAVNATGQDRPVKFDQKAGKFHYTGLDNAAELFPRANQGDYVILENPAEDGTFASQTGQNQAKQLKYGRRIVIPGPWTNALWPGQAATVVSGHRLRTNQYLVAMIYDEKEAQDNWSKAVVKAAEITSDEEKDAQTTKPEIINAKGLPVPESFAVGTRIVIRGTDVSFFIPPTGVEVLKDERGECVREAVTLGQLEYACLIDESGKKEFPKGPKVVFPKPTQVFDTDSKGRRKFRPLELNTINGIHLKVTANFTGDDLEKLPGPDGKRPQRTYTEGEELFITGKTLQIYYPREELAIIEYGQGNRKHYSTAIPKGEARYIIGRETGVIDTVAGPSMKLCDPRKEIMVRRVLSPAECELMYPGNREALQYNLELAAAQSEQPSGRSGFVSEGDYQKRNLIKARAATRGLGQERGGAQHFGLESSRPMADMLMADFNEEDTFEPEQVGTEGHTGGTIARGTQYTQPRKLVLNTKYDGVPKIEIWPGSAVLIVGAEGERRVEIGPKKLLLKYEETFGHMSVSTGTPKSADKLLKIGYLQIHQNQVGDLIEVESSDHVRARIKLSLRVNFEGETDEDRLKWFQVDNYIKYLTDHVRSIIAGTAKKFTIGELKAKHVEIVRDAILGAKPEATEENADPHRPGMFFDANNMRVVECEVEPLQLVDASIAGLLQQAEMEVVKSDITLAQERKRLEVEQERQRIRQQTLKVQAETQTIQAELEAAQVKLALTTALIKLDSELQQATQQEQIAAQNQKVADVAHDADLARRKADQDANMEYRQKEQELKLQAVITEAEAAVKRFQAAQGNLSETLVALQRDDLTAKLAQAFNLERFISGDSVDTALSRLLVNFPVFQKFLEGAMGNGSTTSNRLKAPAKS
jgi:major vault protein